MAYNANNEIREELAQIQKNNRGEYVIAAKITNKTSGAVSVDIRQYFTNEADEITPTSRGIRINAELLPDLLNGLVRALEANEMMDLSDMLSDLAEGTDDSDMPEE